jgi:hypothetical protein
VLAAAPVVLVVDVSVPTLSSPEAPESAQPSVKAATKQAVRVQSDLRDGARLLIGLIMPASARCRSSEPTEFKDDANSRVQVDNGKSRGGSGTNER